MPSVDLIFGAVVGTSGSGLLALIWTIVKDTRARKTVNEETAVGQLRYLKEAAEQDAADERAKADRAWRLVAWYRANYALLWREYKVGPPPGEKDFPFGPPDDIY